jgi:uncharacterized alkaline shock family protein YloU
MENDREIGRTNFASGLLNSVIALSAKEVHGVARVSADFGFSVRGIMHSLRARNGVVVTGTEDGLVVDVCIWIDYGYAAADVCYRVQENIINAAGSMTDKKIKNVNVRIANVNTPYFEVRTS